MIKPQQMMLVVCSRPEEIANTESSLEDQGRARLTCRAAVLGLAVAVVGEAGGDDPSTWGPSPDPIFGRNTMMSVLFKEDVHLWRLL